MNQPFGEAVILPHPAMTAAQAEKVCRDYGLRLASTFRGVAHFEPGTQGLRPAPAATDPEAA